EPQEFEGKVAQWSIQNQKEFEDLANQPIPALEPGSLFVDPAELKEGIDLRRTIYLDQLSAWNTGQDIHLECSTRAVRKYHGDMRELAKDLRERTERSADVVLAQTTLGKAERLHDVLKEYDLPCATEFGDQSTGNDGFLKRIGQHHPIIVVGDVFEG